eukprot:g929.t1
MWTTSKRAIAAKKWAKNIPNTEPENEKKMDMFTGTCALNDKCGTCGYKTSMGNAVKCRPIGQYAGNKGSEECIPCEAGKAVNASTGASRCDDCDRGRYQDEKGKGACKACDVGTRSAVKGSKNCTACVPGMVASEQGLSVCSECSAGRFRSALNTTCVPCPKGWFQNTSGRPLCMKCARGEASPAEGSTFCLECSPGTFAEAGASLCEDCQEDTYSEEYARNACKNCSVGQFAPRGSRGCQIKVVNSSIPPPELTMILPTPDGIQVTFRSGRDCASTTIRYKFNTTDFIEVEGKSNVHIPANGWSTEVAITAVCEKKREESDPTASLVPQWRTASSCRATEYLQVFQDDDQVTRLPLFANTSGPQCLPCKPGADCSGSVVGIAGTLPLLPDHWQVPWNELGKGDGVWAEECIVKGACNATGCVPPYSGPLCGMCEPGATRGAGRVCLACPGEGENEARMAGLFLLASMALVYLIYDGVLGAGRIEKTGVLPFHTLALRTLISYLQVASMIRLYDMKLPAAVDGLITVETAASSAGDTMVSIDCATSASPLDIFVMKQAIVYLAPFVLTAILALFQCARRCAGRANNLVALDQFVASVMVVLNLLFPTLVKRSALMFSCRSIGGRSFLDEVLDVECWQSEHIRAFMMTSLPGAIVFVMGFPLGLLFLLFRLKNRGALKHNGQNYDKRWVLRLGFLFAGYEDEYVYWEGIVLARKALLSTAAVFLAYNGIMVQVVVAILILFVCLYLQMKYEPFEHDWHDVMEERSLMFSNLILIGCLLANAGDAGSELPLSATVSLSVFVFAITIYFFWTSVRMTLIGMHRSQESRFAVRLASSCLRRFHCCCLVAIDDEEDRRVSMALTAKGRLEMMGAPKAVADVEPIEMVDLRDMDWTMMPRRPEPLRQAQPSAVDRPTQSKWKRRYSEEHDQEFFENTESQEMVWELPRDAVLEPLPKGWQRRFSAEHDKHYYANAASGESVWNVSEIEKAP